jgi:hypothetical protein
MQLVVMRAHDHQGGSPPSFLYNLIFEAKETNGALPNPFQNLKIYSEIKIWYIILLFLILTT